jgi:hypothetical protein
MIDVTVRERVRIRDKVSVRLMVGFVKGGALWLG